jgi:tryptophan synthase beta chain
MKKNRGYYGKYGGAYIPEILRDVFGEIETGFEKIKEDCEFQKTYKAHLKNFVGRPTPLLYAENSSKILGGAKIFLKLEGLANTGAHKINNALGQALLAKWIGKKRIIAETGAGQHGVAVSAICAKLGMDCTIYMGEKDVKRQYPNVFWMQQFGARVCPVHNGSRTLKDAVNEAIREWTKNPEETYYLLGSALGAHPFPEMVKYFQSIIGKEVKEQIKTYDIKKPDIMIACVGGGSNAIGFFSSFLNDESVRMIGVEAGGKGLDSGQHAARITGKAVPGIIQGYKSYFLQDEDGQLRGTHSISAGLDYPGIGPELAFHSDNGRIEFTSATDKECLDAFRFFAKNEGIIPALESSHALAEAIKIAPTLSSDVSVLINVSGRGEKDLFITAMNTDQENWIKFLKEEANV